MQHLFSKVFQQAHANCPMKGKRFPELVAGELYHVLHRIGSSTLQDLTMITKFNVSAAEWAVIYEDLEAAKAYAQAAMLVKFDWVSRLPWSLGALAIADQCRARSLITKVVAEFDALPVDEIALHHPRALFFWMDH